MEAGWPERDFVQLTEDHIGSLLEIERSSFANPWSAVDFHCVVRDRSALCTGLLIQGELCGYAIGYVDGVEFHLANFAIASPCRRRGWASILLQHIIGRIRRMGCRKCTLEVRLSNRPAVEFYRRHDFQQIGVRSHYYENPSENALIMQLRLEKVSACTSQKSGE